ncbi:hypothetical protein FO519_009420 [Halicephalobus sp. NKZ332]|nr:hypothetical protein FO519_009420 [Halicephalobus sp. NKZ332]
MASCSKSAREKTGSSLFPLNPSQAQVHGQPSITWGERTNRESYQVNRHVRAHNPSPYMRRFQLPNLSFTDTSGYDELLSPLDSESKRQLIEEKNKQLSAINNYFGHPGTSEALGSEKKPNPSGKVEKSQNFSRTKIVYNQLRENPPKVSHEAPYQVPPQVPLSIPPPVPPHRPHPRQKLAEIEKYRMCKFLKSKNIKNERIAFVTTVLTDEDYIDYSMALDSVECYASHYGYHVELINISYEDLFAFEICTRFALGDGSYFSGKKLKIVRKGTWGWVRDGWLTGSNFASGDFMFHGWKKQKLNKEWIWPFVKKNFNLKNCDPGSPFFNFEFRPEFLKPDREIKKILKNRKDEVNEKYIEVLKKLGKL